MRNLIFILAISSLLISCGTNRNKQKELELKEKELALKEKELHLDSIQKSIKAETSTSNKVAPTSQTSKEVVKTSKQSENTGDKDKFIGKFTWSGIACAHGCFYTHIFKQDGTVKTTFVTSRSSEDYTENWTVDENTKVIKIGEYKWYYKFSSGKIKLTNCQNPEDTHELTREN